MNLLVLSSFIVGPVMVACYLIRQQTKIDEVVEKFNSQRSRPRR